MELYENSLYRTPQERDELLSDVQKVADAFFINFLGTMGLVSIDSGKTVLRQSIMDDGEHRMLNVGDANKDMTLSVKLYMDVGAITSATANRISRLLLALKQRKVSTGFDEAELRDIVSEIKIASHRPSPRILKLVNSWMDGEITLQQYSKTLYMLIKALKDYQPIAAEFMEIARRYLTNFADVKGKEEKKEPVLKKFTLADLTMEPMDSTGYERGYQRDSDVNLSMAASAGGAKGFSMDAPIEFTPSDFQKKEQPAKTSKGLELSLDPIEEPKQTNPDILSILKTGDLLHVIEAWIRANPDASGMDAIATFNEALRYVGEKERIKIALNTDNALKVYSDYATDAIIQEVWAPFASFALSKAADLPNDKMQQAIGEMLNVALEDGTWRSDAVEVMQKIAKAFLAANHDEVEEIVKNESRFDYASVRRRLEFLGIDFAEAVNILASDYAVRREHIGFLTSEFTYGFLDQETIDKLLDEIHAFPVDYESSDSRAVKFLTNHLQDPLLGVRSGDAFETFAEVFYKAGKEDKDKMKLAVTGTPVYHDVIQHFADSVFGNGYVNNDAINALILFGGDEVRAWVGGLRDDEILQIIRESDFVNEFVEPQRLAGLYAHALDNNVDFYSYSRIAEFFRDKVSPISDGVLRSLRDSMVRNPHYWDSRDSVGTLFPVIGNDELFEKLQPFQQTAVEEAVNNFYTLQKAMGEIFSDDVPIKPYEGMTIDRLREVMSYNNIQFPILPREQGESYSAFHERVKENAVNAKPNVLYAEEVRITDAEKKRLTVEFESRNSHKHGTYFEVLRAFDVNIPVQASEWVDFANEKEGKENEVMSPVYHGTGSIGASMILRYGFAVVESTDKSVVGRMLGDGIYFSDVVDKVAQYIGDIGYSRGIGTRGYIFEMDAQLGEQWVDHQSAGVPNATYQKDVVSPEWAVFKPNGQLRIRRAYEVQLISKNDMMSIQQKALMESFTDNIRGKEVANYVFMDGTIPLSKSVIKRFDSLDRVGRGIIDISGRGPMVVIKGVKTGGTFYIKDTREWLSDPVNKHEVQKFLSSIR
nr:MAG TPA: hypothetical protein [Caudoviricetes sp.]